MCDVLSLLIKFKYENDKALCANACFIKGTLQGSSGLLRNKDRYVSVDLCRPQS